MQSHPLFSPDSAACRRASAKGTLRRTVQLAALALGSFAALQPLHAAEWQIDYGHGSRDGVKKVELAAIWDLYRPLWQGERWQLKFLHEANVARWHVPDAKNIYELGYSPYLRFQRGGPSTGSSISPFIEASTAGVRLLSHTRTSQNRTLSTAFQFSSAIGVGVQWGQQGAHTLGVRYQHISNASIKKPNPGINFSQFYYRHSF